MNSNVTLKQIADALGISTMTVSRALNHRSNVNKETKQRVLEKAREMGYTPNHIAKSLVSSKTYTIGVVIPEISHSFFPEVVRGIEEAINNSNYQLFLTNSNEQFEREKEAVRMLQSKRVDGVLVSSCQSSTDFSFYEQLVNQGSNIVFFDRCIENIGVSCVSVNDRVGMQNVTKHLIEEHGYQRIAYLGGPPDVSIGKARYEGFLDAMKEHQIPVKKHFVVESGFQENRGYESMKKLLEQSKDNLPEAVVCVNDPCAIGAMNAINEYNFSIPDDIAITGFTDDIRAPLLNPPLTTIHQPGYKVGKRAAVKLINTIENKDETAENIEVLTSLKIRETCGCCVKL